MIADFLTNVYVIKAIIGVGIAYAVFTPIYLGYLIWREPGNRFGSLG